MLSTPPSVEDIERLRPGSKGLIVKDGKVLVVREKVVKHEKEEIINDFPGGGIDTGEDMEEALLREIYEELGLKVKNEGVIGAWDFVVTNSQDITKGVQIICIGFHCTLVGDDEIDMTHNPAEEDIFDVVWMTPDEILEQGKNFLHHEGMLDAVRALKAKLER